MKDFDDFVRGNYYPSYSLRISEELKSDLMAIAKENGRSMNKQIEFTLLNFVKQYKNENK